MYENVALSDLGGWLKIAWIARPSAHKEMKHLHVGSLWCASGARLSWNAPVNDSNASLHHFPKQLDLERLCETSLAAAGNSAFITCKSAKRYCAVAERPAVASPAQ